MGGGASSAKAGERRMSADVVQEMRKPLDASDITTVEGAKKEIVFLRNMAKSKKCAAGALESLRPLDAGDIMTYDDGKAEVARLRKVFNEQTEFMVSEGHLDDDHWDTRNPKGELSASEMKDLELRSRKRLSASEIQALYAHFNTISAIDSDDGMIDESEFAAALGLEESNYIMQRIFHVIDLNGDGQLNFAEFVIGLSHLCSRAPEQDRLYFSFSMYDVENKGKLSKSTVFVLLKKCLENFHTPFTDTQIKRLVENTFNEADRNHNGIIDFAEYMRMVPDHPMMLHQMSINITAAIMERAQSRAGTFIDKGAAHIAGTKQG